MALRTLMVVPLLVVALPTIKAIFDGLYRHSPPSIHADLLFPKRASPMFHPFSPSADKFYPFFVPSRPPKKPKYYFVGKLTDGWKAVDVEKKEMGLVHHSFRPVSILDGFNSLPKFDDVKPVTEHIEGDLKYDFRTNTHHI